VGVYKLPFFLEDFMGNKKIFISLEERRVLSYLSGRENKTPPWTMAQLDRLLKEADERERLENEKKQYRY